MADIQQAFMSLPPVTRTLLAGTGLTTLPTALAILSPYLIVFDTVGLRKLQLWRLVTPFFYAGSGLSALFNIFFLYRCSNDLEDGIFKHRTADYAWSLVCMAGAIIAMNIPLGSLIFFRALLLALTHLWAQYSPDQPMNLYGFVTLPARYISFALMAMDLLQGGPKAAVEGLTGIISAHVFHYLSEIYPRANPQAANWMATPAWFKRLFAAARGGGGPPGRAERSVGSGATAYAPPRRSGTSTAAAPHRPSGVTGHTWGRGNRLD